MRAAGPTAVGARAPARPHPALPTLGDTVSDLPAAPAAGASPGRRLAATRSL
ncbi:hypothetical protein ACFYXJ_01685 [Streptomyces sp. NPDC002667]|uniref:hypothetical protein n=1 Tax=Streptomyces sp. NPDC002667 TaxID=3364657 RepID=UPI00368C8759